MKCNDHYIYFVRLTILDRALLISLFSSVDLKTYTSYFNFSTFYRAMHFSAKRGIAIACRLSVCLSVCNVGEL